MEVSDKGRAKTQTATGVDGRGDGELRKVLFARLGAVHSGRR